VLLKNSKINAEQPFFWSGAHMRASVAPPQTFVPSKDALIDRGTIIMMRVTIDIRRKW
jgi:hypothetical protein